MALPKLDVPIHELTLPSTGEKLKYRPFLVKEQKLLFMANEGEDSKEMVDSLRQIITNCCIDDIEVEDLPIFDIEYIFLQLRSKSVGEQSTLQFKCQNVMEESTCGGIVEMNLDLSKIKVHKDKKHNPKIQLTKDLGMIMRYPKIELLSEIEGLTEGKEDMNEILKIIVKCIDNIYDSDNVYSAKDHTLEELEEFLLGMTQDQFEKIQLFFETMPKLKENVKYKCNKCGLEDAVDLEGLQSFF